MNNASITFQKILWMNDSNAFAEIRNGQLKHDLIHRIIISIIPGLLSEGTRLFKHEEAYLTE